MKTIFKLSIIISMLIYSAHCWAGVNTAAFLNVGVGARALGMGGAFIAVADDASCSYWNPAGLGMMEKISVGSMVQMLGSVAYPTLEDIAPQYHYLNVIVPLKRVMVPDKGTVSISFISNTLDKIPYTTRLSDGYVLRQEVKDTENALIFSYGREFLFEGLLLGAGLKYVSQKIDTIPGGSATGYGLELGAYYRMDERLSFGFVTQSGVIMKWDNGHTDSGSLRNRAGVAYILFDKKKLSLLTSFDVVQKRKYPLEGHFGTEFSYHIDRKLGQFELSKISLRTGIDGIALEDRYRMQGRMNENLNWTMGAGFEMPIMESTVSFDYAMGSTMLGSRHRVSLSLYF